jgi:hypothetical protein
VYDLVAKVNSATAGVPLAKVADDGYHVYLIGSVVPGSKYIWVAPSKNPDNVKEIWVDRFILVRDE